VTGEQEEDAELELDSKKRKKGRPEHYLFALLRVLSPGGEKVGFQQPQRVPEKISGKQQKKNANSFLDYCLPSQSTTCSRFQLFRATV